MSLDVSFLFVDPVSNFFKSHLGSQPSLLHSLSMTMTFDIGFVSSFSVSSRKYLNKINMKITNTK